MLMHFCEASNEGLKRLPRVQQQCHINTYIAQSQPRLIWRAVDLLHREGGKEGS